MEWIFLRELLICMTGLVVVAGLLFGAAAYWSERSASIPLAAPVAVKGPAKVRLTWDQAMAQADAGVIAEAEGRRDREASERIRRAVSPLRSAFQDIELAPEHERPFKAPEVRA